MFFFTVFFSSSHSVGQFYRVFTTHLLVHGFQALVELEVHPPHGVQVAGALGGRCEPRLAAREAKRFAAQGAPQLPFSGCTWVLRFEGRLFFFFFFFFFFFGLV